jgi:hypothetical protein
MIPWLLINKNVPAKHSWISKEELAHIEGDNSATQINNEIRKIWPQ